MRCRSVCIGLRAVCASLALVVLTGCVSLSPPKRTALTRAPLPQEQAVRAAALAEELRRDVTHLAGAIGPRSAADPEALERAAAWIERSFADAGYEVRRQTFTVEVARADGTHGPQAVSNIEATLPGKDPAGGIVIVGAHYDTEAGSATPGADDNASGVAAMLALARALGGRPMDRTVRFVAWVNEEPPYFKSARMGSAVHAREARERGDRVTAALSLECLGYYSDEPGSQNYPALGWLLPDRGDFVAFITTSGGRKLSKIATKSFRRHGHIPAARTALPGFVQGVDWSDHWAYLQEGYPALMVTDTALFRNGHYHERTDAPDTLDYPRFAKVVLGLEHVVADLASRHQ